MPDSWTLFLSVTKRHLLNGAHYFYEGGAYQNEMVKKLLSEARVKYNTANEVSREDVTAIFHVMLMEVDLSQKGQHSS